MPNSPCPVRAEWQALAACQIEDVLADDLRRHLQECGPCKSVWDEVHLVTEVANEPSDPTASDAGEASDAGQALTTSSLASRPDSKALHLGTLGRYRLLARIGQGGMGEVFRAFDPQLAREVAIKSPLLSDSGVPTAAATERFVREARVAAKVRHRHICAVYDVGEEHGKPFVVMAYLPGPGLNELVRQGAMDAKRAATLVARVALALQAVHDVGIIHRDIKTSNILLDLDGEPMLTDFGLARAEVLVDPLTAEGEVVGTPTFMAPEQARGEPATVASDLYGLGVVLYHLITAQLPFTGTALEVLGKAAHQIPPPPSRHRPDLDRNLEMIVQRAIAPRPADRFPSAAAFAQALIQWSEGTNALQSLEVSFLASNPSGSLEEPKPDRVVAPIARGNRRRWILWGTTLLGFVVFAAIFWPGHELEDPSPESPTNGQPNRPKLPVLAGTSPFDALAQASLPKHELSLLGDRKVPDELIAIWGDSRLCHADELLSLSFHPDGKTLASGGKDDKVILWDLDTGMAIRHLPGRRAEFSPDGQLLAIAGPGGRIALYDMASNQALWDNGSAHVSDIADLVFHPTGKAFISAGNQGDRSLILWDVASGKRHRTYPGGSATIASLDFNRDGSRLAVLALDRTFTIWESDLEGMGQKVLSYRYTPKEPSNANVGDAIYSHDDGLLLFRLGNLRSLDLTQREVTALPGLPESGVQALARSPRDGGIAAWVFSQGLVILDSRTGMVTQRIRRQGDCRALAFSRDGQRVAAADSNGVITVLDVQTGLPTPSLPPRGKLKQVAMSPDSRLLGWVAADGSLHLRDFGDSGKSIVFEPKSTFTGLAFGRTPTQLFAARSNAGIVAVDPVTLKVLDKFATPAARRVSLGPDGRHLLFLCNTPSAANALEKASPRIRAIDLQDEQRSIRDFPVPSALGKAFDLSPNGKWLAFASLGIQPGSFFAFDSGETLGSIPPGGGNPEQIAFDSTGTYLALPGDRHLQIVAVPSGKELAVVPGACRAVAYGVGGKLLAVGQRDAIVLLESSSLRELRRFPFPHFPDFLMFDATGRHLLAATGNGALFVFRLISN